MTRTVKIAVVGTGLAGLTAAHLLKKQFELEGASKSADSDVEFEVHIFEKAPSIGMDCSSISITVPGSKADWRVNVPMRSFQGGYYSHLISLYKTLGVKFRLTDFSYSFSSLFLSTNAYSRRITTTTIYNGGSGCAGVSKPSSLGGGSKKKLEPLSSTIQRARSTWLYICLAAQLLLCYIITIFCAVPIWRSTSVPNTVFRDWTKVRAPLAKWCGMDAVWQNYIYSVVLPMLSGICTASEEDVMNYPLEEILDFIWLTFGTHHYAVDGGVREVVARLAANMNTQHIHLSSPITAIQSDPQDPRFATIQYLYDGQAQEITGFRHIILATQAVRAIPLLTSYLGSLPSNKLDHVKAVQDQIQCLKSFQYRQSVVVNHTDNSLLPDDERDIRDLNLITLNRNSNYENLSEKFRASSGYTMTTYVLPRPEGYPKNEPQVYQTTSPIIEPKKDCILSEATLERAIVTMESKKALASLFVSETRRWWQCRYQATTRLGAAQGARDGDSPGIWICGSYAHSGIPLLEGCVISARNVVEQGILKSEGVQWVHKPWLV